MKIHSSLYLSSLFLSLFFFCSLSSLKAQNGIINSIWEGVGGKSTWQNTRFILFVVKGNELSSSFKESRRFLLNKSNGEVRFEGKNAQGDRYIFLFNYQSQKLKKVYKNQIEIKNASSENELFQELLAQFNEDSSLLFIQTFLDKSGSKLGSVENKISNAEKVNAIPFKTFSLMNKPLSGKVYTNSENFLLRNLELNDEEYLIDGYKDIGGGLTLPTIFKNTADSSKSSSYSLVASFTEMEESKFSTL